MESRFIIEIDMMAQGFWSSFCIFNLGEEGGEALRIFNQLSGQDHGLMRFNLLQKDNHSVIATKYCTLRELELNCRMLAKEIFKIYNFE